MLTIYVGDSKEVVSRVRSNHCNGNVEASALRQRIATYKGYTLSKTKRHSGSMRIRLNLPDPQVGEQIISQYLQSGIWKFVLFSSYEEAHDFQWFLIDKLKPLLNVKRNIWDKEQIKRYVKLLNTLNISPGYTSNKLDGQQEGPGVYVIFHNKVP